MKKIALFLTTILMGSVAIFAWGQGRTVSSVEAPPFVSGCDGDKREVTSNGVQVRLEICGSDQDGYDIDAANPSTGEKWDCRCELTLRGVSKSSGDSVEISRSKTITVSSTSTGWFNAWGESGIKEGKNFKISSFSASCSK